MEKLVPNIRFPGFTDPWKQRKLTDVVIRSSACSSDRNLPRIEYEDIVADEGRLNKDVFTKGSLKSGLAFFKGDILYGKLRPYLHNWLLPTFNGIAVGDFWVLRPEDIDNNFLFTLIQTQRFDEVANQSTGSKMPRADWKLVANSKFPMPRSIEEQIRIGKLFRELDDNITLHQRKLDELKELKKGLLQQMFV